MKMNFRVAGLEKVKSRVKAIPTEVEAALRKEIFDAANEVMAQSVRAIEAPKSGREYKARGYSWRASAPGEAPAKRSGKNLSLIRVKKINRKGKPGSTVRLPNVYKLLERGMARAVTAKGRVMGEVRPRPLMGPIMQKYRNKFHDRVASTVSNVMKVKVKKR